MPQSASPDLAAAAPVTDERAVPERWGTPFLLTGLLTFASLFIVVVIGAAKQPDPITGKEIARGLVTELLGFALTAGVIGYFIRRETSISRARHTRHRRRVAARQAMKVQDHLALILTGSTAFGPHYVELIVRLQRELERLDGDLSELYESDDSEHPNEETLAIQSAIRSLLDELEAVASALRGADKPMPMTDRLRQLAVNTLSSLGSLQRTSE